MKNFLKRRVIPPWLWEDLRTYKKWASRRKKAGLGIFLKTVLKERLRIRQMLDYRAKNILLDIHEVSELGRTTACAKEPETVSWIEEHVKEGDVFYDIGANIGAYSLVAHAATGGRSRIYAFEPSFSTFAALVRNIFLNGFQDAIIPLQIILSDKTEVVSFEYADIRSGASQHSVSEARTALAERTAPSGAKAPNAAHGILSYRLDDLIETFKLPMPNHIKIDVDGTENEVLEGARRTLTRPEVRTLLVEIDKRTDPGGKALALIGSCGFSTLSKHARGGGSKVLHNYLFEKRNV